MYGVAAIWIRARTGAVLRDADQCGGGDEGEKGDPLLKKSIWCAGRWESLAPVAGQAGLRSEGQASREKPG